MTNVNHDLRLKICSIRQIPRKIRRMERIDLKASSALQKSYEKFALNVRHESVTSLNRTWWCTALEKSCKKLFFCKDINQLIRVAPCMKTGETNIPIIQLHEPWHLETTKQPL